MNAAAIITLRIVIALSLAGSLLVQTVIVPLLWIDLEGAPMWFRVSFVVTAVLWVLTLQVTAVCIWRLLGFVRAGTVFSHRSFRYVDVVIGAILAASALTFVFAVLLAPGDTAPGLVGLVCGAALVTAGVALVIVVMRGLLAQAVDKELESRRLRSELDEVI
jgi:hypothetical protein